MEIRDETGRQVYLTFGAADEQACQVSIVLADRDCQPVTSNATVLITPGDLFECDTLDQTPWSTPRFSRRWPWQKIFSDAFGRPFRELVKSCDDDTRATLPAAFRAAALLVHDDFTRYGTAKELKRFGILLGELDFSSPRSLGKAFLEWVKSQFEELNALDWSLTAPQIILPYDPKGKRMFGYERVGFDCFLTDLCLKCPHKTGDVIILRNNISLFASFRPRRPDKIEWPRRKGNMTTRVNSCLRCLLRFGLHAHRLRSEDHIKIRMMTEHGGHQEVVATGTFPIAFFTSEMFEKEAFYRPEGHDSGALWT